MWLEGVEVVLQHLDAAGRCLRTTTLRATRVGYAIDENERRVLTVGRDKKQQVGGSVG